MRSLVLSLALLCFATVASAQLPSYITGHVTSGGTPLPGVTVILKSKNCDCTKCTEPCTKCCPRSVVGITDARGAYTFQLGPGEFEITVEISGFQTKKVTVTAPVGGTTQDIDMSLGVPESITVTSVINPVKTNLKVVDAKSGKALKNTELVLSKRTRKPETVSCVTGDTGKSSVKATPGVYDVVVAKGKFDVPAGAVVITQAGGEKMISVKDQR